MNRHNLGCQASKILIASIAVGLMAGCEQEQRETYYPVTEAGQTSDAPQFCIKGYGDKASINEQFVAMSHLIKDSANAKLISVDTAPACTYVGVVKNVSTGKTTKLFALPTINESGEAGSKTHYIAGDMFNVNGVPSATYQDATPELAKTSLAAPQTATSAKNPVKRTSSTLQAGDALKYNPHIDFFGGLSEKQDVLEKQLSMLEYGYNLEGATVNPEGDLRMVIFYDPFCPHCHDLYKKLRLNTSFAQRWVPISLGLDERGAHLGGMIAVHSKTDNEKGVELMNQVMLTERLPPLREKDKKLAEMVSDSNTQFILPILIQEKAGSPFLFVETGGGEIEFFPGVPNLLQIKKWE